MNSKLEHHYKEFVRLSEVCDKHVESSFNDFKLLGALGALLSWGPISNITGKVPPDLVLIGFLAIIVITGLIGIYSLLRQSVVNFYLQEIQEYEEAIRKDLGDNSMGTFRVAEHWSQWSKTQQRKIGTVFYVLFYLAAILIPTLVLWDSPKERAIYLIVAAVIIAMHILTISIVYSSKIKT